MTPALVKDPVYLQLTRLLRDSLRSKGIGPGQRFLTEREISARFGVSRATANKALSGLVAEGVLDFRKGIGTYVRSNPLDYDLRRLVSFTDKAQAAGKSPSTRVLRFGIVPAERVAASVRQILGVEAADQLYRVERLRLADGVPVILERRYVIAALCPGLVAEDFAGSLYGLWTDRFQLPITGADEIIRAVSIRGRRAKHLEVRQGAAGLLVLALGLLEGNRPLWWERTLYRGNAYEFHNRLGPVQSVRPAAGVLRGPDGARQDNTNNIETSRREQP